MSKMNDELNKFKHVIENFEDEHGISEGSILKAPDEIAAEVPEMMEDLLSDTEYELIEYINNVDITRQDQLQGELGSYSEHMIKAVKIALQKHLTGLEQRVLENLDRDIG